MGKKEVLHRKLLLPCPYLVEGPEVCGPDEKNNNPKKKNSGSKPKQGIRHHQTKHHMYWTDTDSSSEEECHIWRAVTRADPPLNAEAEEICPRRA